MEIFEWTEQTPVTANNLNEMQNILNDKFNYTQEEQRIGTWIDGKPLYRKVFSIINPAETNTNYEDLTSYDMETIVHLYGFYKNSTGTFGIPFHDSDTNYSVMFVSGGKQLRGRFGIPANIIEAKVVIEYTKTTD